MLQSPFLIFILSCVTCLSTMLPGFGLFGAILWGFTLFLAGMRQSGRTVVFYFILDLMVLYMGFGIFASTFYVLAVGLPCTVIGMMAAERKDYYLIRKTSFLMGSGGAILHLGFLYFTLGSQWEGIRTSFVQSAQAFIQEFISSGALDSYLNQGFSTQQLIDRFAYFADIIVHLFPTFFFAQMILAIYAVLMLVNIYGMKQGEKWLFKKPLAAEQMPWQLAWVMIAGLFMAFWDYGTGSVLFYAGINLMAIMTLPGFYFGCAVVSGKYYSYTPEKRRNAVIIFFILCIFVAEILAIFIMLLGIFDSVLDYRRLNAVKPDKKPD